MFGYFMFSIVSKRIRGILKPGILHPGLKRREETSYDSDLPVTEYLMGNGFKPKYNRFLNGRNRITEEN